MSNVISELHFPYILPYFVNFISQIKYDYWYTFKLDRCPDIAELLV